MDPGPPLGEELRHGAVGVAGFEQLDLDVTEREADNSRAVRGLGGAWRKAEDVPVEGECGVDRPHSDADVGDAGGGLAHVASEHNDCTKGVERYGSRTHGGYRRHV